jgi:hypothetical protein
MVTIYGCFAGKDDYEKILEADNGSWVKYEDYQSELAAANSRITELEKIESNFIDWIDLMLDEFLRIKSCPAADIEIKQLCKRAVDNIRQHV